MKRLLVSLVLAMAFLAAPLAVKSAEPPAQWAVDPPHCSITFTIKHIFVQIPGRFERFTADVRFSPDDPAGSSVAFTVDAASLNTQVEKRDEDLRSPNFFDVARYPTITFKSGSIERTDDTHFVAKGVLTIKDVSRQVELPFTYLGMRESPLVKGATVAGFESRFPVRLADYHIGDPKWQRMGAMGESAEVFVDMELVRKGQGAEPGKGP